MKRLLLLLTLAGIVLFSGVSPQGTQAQTPPPGFIDVFIDLPSRATFGDRAVINSLGGDVKAEFVTSTTIAVALPQAAVDILQQYSGRFYNIRTVPTATAFEDTIDWGVDHINAERVWGGAEDAVNVTGTAGNGVKVAIIDTGIDRDHPDLAANIVNGYNFIANSTNYEDDNGHGTHVAGTIAALDNGSGLVGVAPQADLYVLKVLNSSGSGTYTNVVRAIEWATGLNGGTKADIISMSLGGPADSALQAAVDNAANAGVLVIAAAGNSGSGTDTVGYPAHYASVTAVASVTSTNARSSFSSTGSAVDIAAPGSSIYSTYPNNSYATLSGTSMATPHVSGVAALVKSANPSMTGSQIRDRLLSTAIDLGTAGPDTSFGYGLVNPVAAVASQGPDETPPTVTARTPAVNATNIETGTTVTATFSEAIDTTTVNTTSFRVSGPGNATVNGAFSFNGITVTFTPSAALAAETQYNVALSSAIQDAAGNGLDPVTSWSFTTARPFVSCTAQAAVTTSAGDNNGFQTNPANACQDGSGAATDTNSGTSTTTSCTATQKDKHVFSNFSANVNNGATINGIEVRLDGWADSTSSSPRFCVQLSWNGGTSWTTAKQTTTLTTSEATYILGTASDNWGRTWTSGELSNANFRVRVISVSSSTSRDFNLDWVALRVTSTGGTPGVADTTPPTVQSTTPASNAGTVAINSDVQATFSEAMNSATLTGSSFTLQPTSGGANLAATVTYANNVATLNPSADLAYSTSYTATIAAAVTDVEGNPMDTAYSWSFTTAAAPADTTNPTVTNRAPATGATGVATSTTIAATFSEAMNATSVTTAGRFTVRTTSGSVNVPGTVTYANNVATFTPSSPLAASTGYTVTLSTSMTDVAGNPLTLPSAWTFTTAAASTACAAPTIVSHTDTNTSGTGTVTFSWNAVSGATSYTVQRQAWWGSWSTISTTASTSFSGSDSGTDNNWRVYVSAGSCSPLPGPMTTFDP